MILTVNGDWIGYTGCEEAKMFYHIILGPFREIWEFVSENLREFSGEKNWSDMWEPWVRWFNIEPSIDK